MIRRIANTSNAEFMELVLATAFSENVRVIAKGGRRHDIVGSFSRPFHFQGEPVRPSLG